MFPSSPSRGVAASSRNRFALLATEVAAAEARADQQIRGQHAAPAARRLQDLPAPGLGYYRNHQSDFRTFDGSAYFVGVSGLTPRDAVGCATPQPYPACVLGLDSRAVDNNGNLPGVVSTPSGNYTNVLVALADATQLMQRNGNCTGSAWGADDRSEGLRQPWINPVLAMSLVCGRGLNVSEAWLKNTTHLLESVFHSESELPGPGPVPVGAIVGTVVGALVFVACLAGAYGGCGRSRGGPGGSTAGGRETPDERSDDEATTPVRVTSPQRAQQAREGSGKKVSGKDAVQLHTTTGTTKPHQASHAAPAAQPARWYPDEDVPL